jgi:hypothetical protein
MAEATAGGGGERGIRTPGPFGSTVFPPDSASKTAAFDRYCLDDFIFFQPKSAFKRFKKQLSSISLRLGVIGLLILNCERSSTFCTSDFTIIVFFKSNVQIFAMTKIVSVVL